MSNCNPSRCLIFRASSLLNLLVGRRTSRLDWLGSRAERSAWVESPRPRGCACTAADFWIRRERRPRLRGNAKVCVVLDLRGLRALAPAMMLVGLLPRLRYLKAFGAIANSRSFDQFAMNRGQNCGYLQSRLWCPCPCSSDKDLRIRADKVCVFMLSVGEIPSSTLFRYRQDSAPIDKPHRREFHPRFFFLDIGRIHAYKPISPSP